jgi:DNA-binding transcriptional LysR family regulator
LSPVVRRGHPLAGARRLADLADAEWVLPTEESASAQALQQAMATRALPAPDCRLTCETFTTMITAVAASDLVGLVPAEMVDRFAATLHIVDLAPEERLNGADLCLIRRRTGRFPPATMDLMAGFAAAAARLAGRSAR